MFPTHELSDRQLRYFGGSLTLFLCAAAALAQWRWQASDVAIALVVGGGLLFVVYYGYSPSRRPIYRVFRKLTYPIQFLMTVIILGFVYYGMLTPIGLLLRWRGVSVRRRRGRTESCWQRKGKSPEPADYLRTY